MEEEEETYQNDGQQFYGNNQTTINNNYNNTISSYNASSFRNLNANSKFIIKYIRSIYTLKLKKKVFDNILIFYYYSKDKKKLNMRLSAFN